MAGSCYNHSETLPDLANSPEFMKILLRKFSVFLQNKSFDKTKHRNVSNYQNIKIFRIFLEILTFLYIFCDRKQNVIFINRKLMNAGDFTESGVDSEWL